MITEGRKVNIMCNRGENLHANCIQIAHKNQHLQMIVRGNREAEPQINADERRFVDRDFQQQRYESMMINNGFSLKGA